METTSKDGFRWVRVGEEPHTRSDGTPTTLGVWQADCKQCGKPFTIKTPGAVTWHGESGTFSTRHCEEHRLKRDRNDMHAFRSSLASFKPEPAQA